MEAVAGLVQEGRIDGTYALVEQQDLRIDAGDHTQREPYPREGVLACARREVREETGLDIDPGRCAFVLDTINRGDQRVIEVVFLSSDRPTAQPVGSEPGMEPEFVALGRLSELDLRPPLAGHIRALHANRYFTAPYLGNLWRSTEWVRDR